MNIELHELASLLRGPSSNPSPPSNSISGQHIVVLDRGFVYVGEVSTTGDFVMIRNAKNVRLWGTTKGLGELRGGPLSGTKMDEVGEVIAPMRAVIHFIPCKGF